MNKVRVLTEVDVRHLALHCTTRRFPLLVNLDLKGLSC